MADLGGGGLSPLPPLLIIFYSRTVEARHRDILFNEEKQVKRSNAERPPTNLKVGICDCNQSESDALPVIEHATKKNLVIQMGKHEICA